MPIRAPGDVRPPPPESRVTPSSSGSKPYTYVGPKGSVLYTEVSTNDTAFFSAKIFLGQFSNSSIALCGSHGWHKTAAFLRDAAVIHCAPIWMTFWSRVPSSWMSVERLVRSAMFLLSGPSVSRVSSSTPHLHSIPPPLTPPSRPLSPRPSHPSSVRTIFCSCYRHPPFFRFSSSFLSLRCSSSLSSSSHPNARFYSFASLHRFFLFAALHLYHPLTIPMHDSESSLCFSSSSSPSLFPSQQRKDSEPLRVRPDHGVLPTMAPPQRHHRIGVCRHVHCVCSHRRALAIAQR
jgi:hypothetical protein